MKNTSISISIFLFCFLANAQTISQSLKDQNIKIVTVDGNIIAGKMVSESDSEIVLITDFGTISIPREKINSLDIALDNKKPSDETVKNDLFYCKQFIRPGGTILCDDYIPEIATITVLKKKQAVFFLR